MGNKEQTLERLRGDFQRLEDGFYYLFPRPDGGCYPPYLLRWIADELDRLNEPHQKEIEKYFSGQEGE